MAIEITYFTPKQKEALEERGAWAPRFMGVLPAQELPAESVEFKLRAMAANYDPDGRSYWDKLDLQVVQKAADEIHALRDGAMYDLLTELRRERDEADRRAGAAERLLAYAREANQLRDGWLEEAKKDAGFDRNVSFDVVWQTALAALKDKRDV